MSAWPKQIKLAIVGAEKAGTTSLFRQLSQATAFVAHQQREIGFFISGFEFDKGEKYLFDKYYPESEGKFLLAKDVRLMNNEGGLLRLKKTCPDVKIIIMLREPASRAYSAYQYSKLRGVEVAKTFEDALLVFDKIIFERGSLFLDKSTLAYASIGVFMLLLSDFRDEYFSKKMLLFNNKYFVIRLGSYMCVALLILWIGILNGGQFIYFKF